MVAKTSQEIRFATDSLELTTRITAQVSRVTELSVQHAKSRGSDLVTPDDVKAAVQDFLVSLGEVLTEFCSAGSIETEYSEEELSRLTRLPCRAPDPPTEADADL
jgi:DNA replicative helicase MCM subunit Mcm2 (Cdc46/Mcm family)